ncbi:TPA: hypothetical protein ACHTGG_004516, partial [Escherichia coli]
ISKPISYFKIHLLSGISGDSSTNNHTANNNDKQEYNSKNIQNDDILNILPLRINHMNMII